MSQIKQKRYLCPVCGFALKYPADDANICPSCGVQFGLDDFDHSIGELRELWLERGAPWSSSVRPAPPNFSGIKQLAEAFFEVNPKEAVQITQPLSGSTAFNSKTK